MESNELFDSSPVPPGTELRELLRKRGWTQDELAVITGRSRQQINDIITGRRGITPEMAVALAAAFNTSASYWLNLDSAFRLGNVSEPKDLIMERARLFDIAPIKDMQKRGWIPNTKDLDELTGHLKVFFEVESLEEGIEFRVSTRKTVSLSELTIAQRAWCFRARTLAQHVRAKRFSSKKLDTAKARLRKLAAYRNEAVHVPELLADYGIRFIVIEPLPGAKIDGVAFWLDRDSPVIATSLRYDRHDYFWFTLMHEFMHIAHGDALSVDDDLGREEHGMTLLKEENERRADEAAADALVPQRELDSFICRVGPLYSRDRIIQFAHSIKMHPGIIVGQLQIRGELGWNALRDTLAKVRELVTKSALTDGWGNIIST